MSEITYPIDTTKFTWDEPTASFYPPGVQEKILYKNEETGSMIALIKYPAGITGKMHVHPDANEAGYYMYGEIEDQQGNPMSIKGLFGVNQKGVEHGQMKALKDTVVMLFWDGPRES